MYQVVQASHTPKNTADWSFVFCFMFSLDKYTFLYIMNFAFRYKLLRLQTLE